MSTRPSAWTRFPAVIDRACHLRVLAFGLALTLAFLSRHASAQVIDTVAGTGVAGFGGDGRAATSAQLNRPSGLAFDGKGNVFIADRGNHRIRMIAVGTGIITTVVGTGVQGYGGDQGLSTNAFLNNPIAVALDPSGNLLIADEDNYRIRQVESGTRIITTLAGTGRRGFAGDGGSATSASLDPNGITVDASGDLLIADSDGERIRQIKMRTGTIMTVAGTGVEGFGGDGSLATSAHLAVPTGVARDARGNLFIADFGNHRIRKVAAGTGIITTVAGSGPTGPDAGGFAGDGGPATNARLNLPTNIVFDANGDLLIADFGNHRIRKVTAGTGIITTVVGSGPTGGAGGGFGGDGGPATSALLSSPGAIALDASGNLFIADFGNHRIRRVTSR